MGVHFYIDQIQEIKQLIYNEIKNKGAEIDKNLPFNEYHWKIREIETASKEEKPYFYFFKVTPEPKNFVFGGGVSKEMGGIYFGAHVDLLDVITDKQIAIGKDSWGTKGLSNIGEQYLFLGDVNVPTVTFVRAQPTCTNKVFGPEDASSSFEIQVI